MIETSGWLFSYTPAKTPDTIEELLAYAPEKTVLRCLPIYDEATPSGRLRMSSMEMQRARKHYHDLSYLLAQKLDECGPRIIFVEKYCLVGFPIGKTFRKADPLWIDKNSKLLRYYAREWDYVILPQISTSNLSWNIIRKILEKNLPDDKFIAVHSYKDLDV